MSYQGLPTSDAHFQQRYASYQQPAKLGTVRNNNPLNPFSSNTTNPKQWGPTDTSKLHSSSTPLNTARDFIELVAFSLFFSGLYWTCIFVTCLVKGYLHSSRSFWISVLVGLILSVPVIAGICYRRCEIWYEYGALEYYQPIKDFLRRGIKRKGIASLLSGLSILAAIVVYGPFMVGAVAYVDELGQREHRD